MSDITYSILSTERTSEATTIGNGIYYNVRCISITKHESKSIESIEAGTAFGQTVHYFKTELSNRFLYAPVSEPHSVKIKWIPR